MSAVKAKRPQVIEIEGECSPAIEIPVLSGGIYKRWIESEQVRRNLLCIALNGLRAPLTIIKGCADALQYGDLGELTDLQVRKVGIINDCADLMAEIVDEFLNADRLSEGLLEDRIWPALSREELDMGRMIYKVERV